MKAVPCIVFLAWLAACGGDGAARDTTDAPPGPDAAIGDPGDATPADGITDGDDAAAPTDADAADAGHGDTAADTWAPADAPVDTPDGQAHADTGNDATEDAAAPAGPVRFAVVSDTHLTADPDDAPNRNYADAMQALAALDTPPERVFVTGDVVADLLVLEDYVQAWLGGAGEPVPVLAEMRRLADTLLPGRTRIVLGNHDNRFIDQFLGNDVPLAAWVRAFAGSDAFPAPWYAEDIRGCRFVVMWSCELATDHASNDLPSFGEAQLAWLRAQLADGLPTVVLWHHWIPRPADEDVPPALLAALADNPTGAARVAFSGHGHAWRRHEWQGTRFHQTAALRDVPGAHHLVACDGDVGTITVLNEQGIPYLE
jgi:3',5'-cyclic AMP phosphodiesterase CpdA